MPLTSKEILESEFDPESTFTVALYFVNLLSFILTMLIYYGLIIVMGIAMLIHLYDYIYNYEEFVAHLA